MMIVKMLGGLALFLYGMEIMGDGLKNSSAGALKKALEKVTSNPVKSFFLGVIITSIIQSSTATIVIVVGLIGAGVLTLEQSVGIVMGANVGTTITAQILRLMDVQGSGDSSIFDIFTPESLAPVAAIIGIVLIMFVKKGQAGNYGMIAIGFGILFIGLIDMTDAMSPLGDSQAFKDLIIKFSSNPIIGLVIGIAVTAIIQSSSASVGVLQSLALTGAINFNFSYAYIIGAAIGTCVTTAIVCSIGAKEDAKRVGAIHIVFNLIGGGLFMVTMEIIRNLGGFPGLWEGTVTSGNIADFQTVFKLVTAILLLPFTPLLIKLSKAIIKDPAVDEAEADIADNLKELNQNLFLTPTLALEAVRHLLCHMCELALKNYNSAVSLLSDFNASKLEKIASREALLDRMADATNNYLITLSPKIETERDNKAVSYMLQSLTEFERIGDLAQNIADNARKMAGENIVFSEGAMKELSVMTDAVRNAIELSNKAFCDTDFDAAARVEPLEEVIDDLNEILRNRHVERLKEGKCTVNVGLYFFDLLINLERLGDQCSDVAVCVLGLKDREILGNEHEYIRNIHKSHDVDYEHEFEKNTNLYIGKLKELFSVEE